MSTPLEQWVECPVCKGTGIPPGTTDWDPDYGAPKCARCNGLGEIDPAIAIGQKDAHQRFSVPQLDELAQRFQQCIEDFCDPDNPEIPRTVQAKCGKLVEGLPCQNDAGHDGECDWVPY